MFRKIDYFYTSIDDESGEGFRFLSRLASHNVDLMAITAVPMGPEKVQFTLFPTDPKTLIKAARIEGINLDGPHSGILVQDKDQVGAFANVLSKLATANVSVFAARGMTDNHGGFGYIVYLRPSDIERALRALK